MHCSRIACSRIADCITVKVIRHLPAVMHALQYGCESVVDGKILVTDSRTSCVLIELEFLE
jgi:hypothetical protein